MFNCSYDPEQNNVCVLFDVLVSLFDVLGRLFDVIDTFKSLCCSSK